MHGNNIGLLLSIRPFHISKTLEMFEKGYASSFARMRCKRGHNKSVVTLDSFTFKKSSNTLKWEIDSVVSFCYVKDSCNGAVDSGFEMSSWRINETWTFYCVSRAISSDPGVELSWLFLFFFNNILPLWSVACLCSALLLRVGSRLYRSHGWYFASDGSNFGWSKVLDT